MEVESARIKLNGGVHKKKPKCGICGKEFSSMKGLYGHMRTHPDRSWRGIEPPTTTAAPSPPRWSLTAPRGRRSTASASASTSTSSAVVEDLMFLAKKESSSKGKMHFNFDMTIITCQYSERPQTRSLSSRGSCGRKMLDFDLNQLPPMEEEDGEGIES